MEQLGFAQDCKAENPPALTGGLAFRNQGVASWSAHFDYFTGTCEDHRGDERFPDQEVLFQLIEAYGTESMKRWQMRDYTGYSIGKVGWAERSTGSIRQITSSMATNYVLSAMEKSVMPNCTRLDITVDVRLMNDTASCISSIATERHGIPGASRLGMPLLMSSYGQGDTFYVGSPKSAKRLRIYDKWKESGGDERYKNVIRWELQLRTPHSQRYISVAGNRENYERTILATVEDHCKRVQCYMPSIPNDAIPAVLRIEEVERTVDQRLNWLATQVAPTVRRLCAMGYRQEALKALGLLDDGLPGIIDGG